MSNRIPRGLAALIIGSLLAEAARAATSEKQPTRREGTEDDGEIDIKVAVLGKGEPPPEIKALMDRLGVTDEPCGCPICTLARNLKAASRPDPAAEQAVHADIGTVGEVPAADPVSPSPATLAYGHLLDAEKALARIPPLSASSVDHARQAAIRSTSAALHALEVIQFS